MKRTTITKKRPGLAQIWPIFVEGIKEGTEQGKIK